MRLFAFFLIWLATALTGGAFAQPAPAAAPRIDERVAQIVQTAPGAPWAFIGYAVTPPANGNWFVANGTPRGGTMGRQLSATESHTAVLVLSSESIGTTVDSDTGLLELARTRHAKIGERWSVQRHEETIVRHAGTRCARHLIEAREPEDRSPRKDADKLNARRTLLHVTGLSCVHPNDATVLIEVGVSERSRGAAMTPEIRKDAEAVIASLAFHRYSEDALQKSAEAARASGLAAAETVLKPYLEANAAWAGYFMAQIVERAAPVPDNVGARLRALLEPAAERGLADAQWALGRLYLRGAPGLDKDPAKAEALLRRAAERGNPGAAFQLGLSQLSGADGIASNSREAALWIQRAAFRGQKEAQEMLAEAKEPPASPKQR
ncbi:MAG: tetratricopeptide repeat protein [Burkholderiaceae bacterium]